MADHRSAEPSDEEAFALARDELHRMRRGLGEEEEEDETESDDEERPT